MDIKKERVYSEELLLNQCKSLLIHEPNSNNFLLIQIGINTYGMAWHGDTEAKFELFENTDLLAIGAGENVVCVSIKTGIVKLALGLGYPFSFFEKVELGFIIVSELTIIQINTYNCSISRFVVAHDIIIDVKVSSGKFLIKCLDREYQV